MTWVQERKREYAAGKRKLEQYRDTLIDPKKDNSYLPEGMQKELATVEDMISDMGYAIEWMRTGRRPNSRRGVDIKDAYKRSILMDMDLLPNTPVEQESRITDAERSRLAIILMKLSERELQCYLLHMANGLSFAEIAKELKLTKRTVQDYVDRAKSKVQQGL